ncbi:MAG: TraR/DksA C4-type zinc finger protein [Desulfuromonadaceae bacterium]
MDEIDQYQPHDERFQTAALKQQQESREPDDNPGIDCLKCYEEIPLKRRLAKPGCRRCITCQETFEMEAPR